MSFMQITHCKVIMNFNIFRDKDKDKDLIIQKLLSILEPLNTFETIQISDSSSHRVCLRGMGPSSCERRQVDRRCTEVCCESLFKIMELKL